jgi:2-oxoglutarate dehydrogenase complex dehydrogenase (E1) component-like enzyme
VPKDTLAELFKKVSTWPDSFNIHPTIKKIFDERAKNFAQGQNMDWATM